MAAFIDALLFCFFGFGFALLRALLSSLAENVLLALRCEP
jgi:hypothetical protein